jgi:hypothetical protein
MGTGPFRMVEFIPDELMVLEKYADYWGWDEKTNVDELRFKIIPELSTAVAELMTGEVDMVRLTADLYDVVDENDGTNVVVQDSLVRAVVMFNVTVHECLEDPRVRQALKYVRTARAKGLRESRVIYLHAVRNAMIPYATVSALQIGNIIAGSMVVESVFAWPGLGRLLMDSIRMLDIPVVAAGLAAVAVIYVILNLIADLSYALLDPRVRHG